MRFSHKLFIIPLFVFCLLFVALLDLELEQLDVKTTFLHGERKKKFTWSSPRDLLFLEKSILSID